jgi:hypothetical protein
VPQAVQQRDEKKAWVSNYDLVFFEVETESGIKVLHEVRPGQMGSMIVSTPVLRRYELDDLIRASPALSASDCVRPPYFRCTGRDKWWTPLRYARDEFRTFNLDRL